jgi:hypothetical protein
VRPLSQSISHACWFKPVILAMSSNSNTTKREKKKKGETKIYVRVQGRLVSKAMEF